MPEMTSYAPGTPSWVDLSSPDIDESVSFYTELFGWEANRIPDPQAGGYTMFQLRGKDVAAVGPIMGEGQPPTWNTFVTTDDAAATAEKINEAGGTVVMEPFDVMGAGHMAVAQDPTGAFFNLWQPGNHIGASIVNEPVSLSWNELNTRDAERAGEFFGEVFGWETELRDLPTGDTYHVQNLGGRPIGGIVEMGAEMREVPPHWLTYFAVEDADATTERAKELDAAVVMGPFDTSVGRISILKDPHGAIVAVIAGVQPQEQ